MNQQCQLLLKLASAAIKIWIDSFEDKVILNIRYSNCNITLIYRCLSARTSSPSLNFLVYSLNSHPVFSLSIACGISSLVCTYDNGMFNPASRFSLNNRTDEAKHVCAVEGSVPIGI
jgi:hypothetical protein